jgi:hypothetical protein
LFYLENIKRIFMKNIVVYGIYPSRIAVEKAVEHLKLNGFRNSDVSVLLSSANSPKDFAHQNSTKSPEGATAGIVSGATIGGVLGWLAGIGSLAIPGVGPFIAAGPIMAALAGVSVGGTVGGFTGALIGYGIPEYEATRYVGRIKDGGILLSVHADNKEWAEKAYSLLEDTGAEDICEKTETPSDDKKIEIRNTTARV